MIADDHRYYVKGRDEPKNSCHDGTLESGSRHRERTVRKIPTGVYIMPMNDILKSVVRAVVDALGI